MKSIKQCLHKGEATFGIFLLSSNSIISEACSVIPGIDWIIIDMEASPANKSDLLNICQSLKGTEVASMVRISELNKHLIESSLDIGLQAILVPKIESKEMAQSVVQYSYYPPLGGRGINPVRASNYFQNIKNYLSTANQEVLIMVQIESVKAVNNVNDIASVKGIDVLFIGCGDLASSLGQPGNVEGEKMDFARNQVLNACKQHGKFPGIFAYNIELAKQYLQEGFKFIAIGNDIKLIQESLSKNLLALKPQ